MHKEFLEYANDMKFKDATDNYDFFVLGVNNYDYKKDTSASKPDITIHNTLFIKGHGRNTGDMFSIPQENKIITYTRYGNSTYNLFNYFLLGNIAGLTATATEVADKKLYFPKDISDSYPKVPPRKHTSENLDKLHIYNLHTEPEKNCDIFPDIDIRCSFYYDNPAKIDNSVYKMGLFMFDSFSIENFITKDAANKTQEKKIIDFELIKKIDIDDIFKEVNKTPLLTAPGTLKFFKEKRNRKYKRDKIKEQSESTDKIKLNTEEKYKSADEIKLNTGEKISILTEHEKKNYFWLDVKDREISDTDEYKDLIDKMISGPVKLSEIMKSFKDTKIKNYVILNCRNNNNQAAANTQDLLESAVNRSESCNIRNNGTTITSEKFKGKYWGIPCDDSYTLYNAYNLVIKRHALLKESEHKGANSKGANSKDANSKDANSKDANSKDANSKGVNSKGVVKEVATDVVEVVLGKEEVAKKIALDAIKVALATEEEEEEEVEEEEEEVVVVEEEEVAKIALDAIKVALATEEEEEEEVEVEEVVEEEEEGAEEEDAEAKTVTVEGGGKKGGGKKTKKKSKNKGKSVRRKSVKRLISNLNKTELIRLSKKYSVNYKSQSKTQIAKNLYDKNKNIMKKYINKKPKKLP
jgi:hypothetical protein